MGDRNMRKITVAGRPVLDLPRTPTEIGLEIFAGIGIACAGLVFAAYWPRLPAVIPTHFGATGAPDATGPKSELIGLLLGNVGIYVLVSIISRFPQLYNYPARITEENAERQYRNARALMIWLKTEAVWTLFYIEWQTIQVALGRSSGMGALMAPVVLVIVLGTCAFYLVRAYRCR